MAVAYNYSSTAGEYTLQMALAPSATSVQLDSVNGLPSAPFKLVIEPGQPTEEVVKVTAIAGTSLTVVRGWDGTNAVAHSAPCMVRHMMTAEDLRLSRQHEDSINAHGTIGNVVGTTDSQALTNKNLTSATNVFPSSLVTLTGTQTLTKKTISGSTNTFSNIPQSAVVGLPSIQSDVNLLNGDTGVWDDTGHVTNASGWTCWTFQIRKIGKLCTMNFTFQRTGGSIATGGDGNLPNVALCTIKSGMFRPSGMYGAVSGNWAGILWNGYVDHTNGQIMVAASVPNQTISNGDTLTGSAMFFTA